MGFNSAFKGLIICKAWGPEDGCCIYCHKVCDAVDFGRKCQQYGRKVDSIFGV